MSGGVISGCRLESILGNNPNFLGVWSSWEPNAIDSLDHLDRGRRLSRDGIFLNSVQKNIVID